VRFEDARRLTGPNLLAQGPLVLAELLPDSESKEVVLAAYAAELNRFRAALGLPNVAPRIAREARGWLGVVFEAPLDEMMAGAESAEWAGLSAVEVLAGRLALPLEPKLTEVTAIIARDRNPRLLEVQAEANARGLPFLWDDESVSVGQGRRSVTFPLHAIPSTIDWSALGAVPIAMITGTNGKTTSTRLLARMAAEASRSVGMSCSDGVTLGMQQVREGDWTGPAAARVVLRSREVDFAVLETARGGILRRGLAVEACDAALITNITDDHLGTYGVDDLEGMAEVKAVVARAVRPGGVVVLNARDPRLVALAPTLDAQVIYFADLDREPSAVIDAHRGRAVVARDAEFIELNNGVARSLLPVRSAPITFKGAARYNVENALGAAAMALGLGLSQAAVVRFFTWL
jgi:cyanophycin synthetase